MTLNLRSRLGIGALVAAGAFTLGACAAHTTSNGATGGEGAAAAPAPPTLPKVTASPTTTAPPTTEAPTTTAAPTTTEAPTTTAAPTTTTPPAPDPVPRLDPPLAAIGTSSGGEAARVQQRLLDLGFWVSGVDGSYGLTTLQAVMAFEKYMGFDADGRVDQQTADALTNADVRAQARADSGTLVEVDKTRQLLFFVIGGRTEWVLNTSTGNGETYTEFDQNTPGEMITGVSLTPDGLHKVNRQRPEGWWEGDLGRIYRPKYFVGGVAVHGSNSIPNYPASHGCVRVSVPAMDWIWGAEIMPMATPVWVHGG